MYFSQNKKQKSIFLILFIFLTLFSLSFSQKSTPIELNQKQTGKLDKDESREYYSLSIPQDKNIEEGTLLVFTVKESHKGIKEGEEIFSDPDIYVSKTKKYPSNREESEWFSERYGSDILTIPPHFLKKGDIFYICMYCQYKCRYELKAYLTKEIPLKFGKFYSFQMLKGESYSYSLYIPKNDQKEDLNIVANNPSLQNFKIFMSKESPSSQNTFQVIPSWAGCYLIPVIKNMKEYCTDCTYHILIQAQENIEIKLNSYFQSTITQIFQGDPINDAIKSGYKRCYEFDLRGREKLNNNKLLIQTNLFSGSVLLKLYGWDKKDIEEKLSIRNLNIDKYLYAIGSEKIILLNNEDFSNFDRNVVSTENKKLYLCIQSQQVTSYLLNIYFLSEAENLQRYNYISPGSELTGYLQGGQVTRYRLLDFNLNKNSDITFLFTTLSGNAEYYASFCSKNCRFSNYNLKQKLTMGEIKISEKIPINSAQVILKKNENKCYLENKDKVINSKCKTLAIVKCEGTPEDICIFKILPTIQEQPTFLFPKKTYYNVITKGKTDSYIINIGDPEFNSVVVVLTTLTGDAELSVYRKVRKNDGTEDEVIIGVSRNRDYIPDVVRITPQKLNSKDVTGQYYVKITSNYFSSYNLYFYATRIKKRDEQPNIKDITASLIEGKIISDYFPNDLPFKIYSYTPVDKSQNIKDIKIVLTRLNVNFSFKVYLDFNKIKYNYDTENKYEEKLKDYIWASDLNNEVTISKDDKNYSKKGPYYIVVTKDDNDESELDSDALTLYYIGVTKKGVPFSLTEGVEHSETLNDNYNFQNYWYIHKDVNEPLQLEINVLNGQVDVFVDVIELSEENITNVYKNYTESNLKKITMGNTVGYFDIRDYTSIVLDKNYFDKIGNNLLNRSSSIFIYISQSKYSLKFHKDSQYIISAKSSLNKGLILLSGQTIYSQFESQLTHHYIIQEVKHRKGTTINLRFTKGYGEIYVSISDSNTNELEFPDEKKYDYKGKSSYKGKIVKIPAKVFDKINKKSLKLKILISVIPNFYRFANEIIEYSISYSSEPKKINQNFPYQSFINAGEFQYFTFYFGKNTENIYISLSNMNGDADMYLNYGTENLPTPNKNNWASTSMGHEYIDINVKNSFFKENNKDDISGYYTLLILGYTETVYTLYISSHKENILTLTNNSPVSCRCHTKNDKCYFRFNDVFIDNKYKSIYNKKTNNQTQNEVFFTTQYIYGNGKMYAKILKDQEITEDTKKKYQEFFPTEKNFDYSNSMFGKRNYLKVIVQGKNYSKDSLILLTFICEERTDVSITAAAAAIKPLNTYLDRDRENIFFIKTNNTLKFKDQIESTFTYFSYKEEDLIYELHAYTGKARVRIYTNDSVWNNVTKKFTYDYNHISEFNIKAEGFSDEFSYIKTYKESYFNSISKNLIIHKNVYFSIKPYEDFGFYIQVLYDKSWINIPIGMTKSYLINKNLMYGYFDISRDFANVEMSLSVDERNKKYATVYAKILIINKDPKNVISNNPDEKSIHQEIPSKNNYDYKGETDDLLGTLNLNLENLPVIKDEERDTKFVRVLFTINIDKISSKRSFYYYINENLNPETNVQITITPGVHNFKRVDLPQHTYYLSNTTLIPKRQPNVGIAYDGSKEVKIFSLDKKSNEDKKMFIDISICNGDFEFKISNKITNYDDNKNNIVASIRNKHFGSYRYLIDNLISDQNKHLYLSIKPKQNNLECLTGQKKDSKGVQCSNELSYLIYYYSMTNKEYESKEPDYQLQYEYGKNKQILLIIKPIRGSDFRHNFREQNDIEYNLFYTKKNEYCHYMESICHLSQVLNEMTNETYWQNGDIIVLRNIKVDENYEYPINDIESSDKICVNVLARNLKTNELIAYFPIIGARPKVGWIYKFIFLLVIGLVAIGAFLVYYHIKNIKINSNYQYTGIQTEMKNMGKGGYTSVSLENY